MKTAVVALALAGCSFVAVQTPHGSPPECTESSAAPVVDLLIAVATPFVVYAAVRSGHDSQMNPDDQLDDVLAALVAGMVSTPIVAGYGASSIYGFVKTSKCSRIKAEFQRAASVRPQPATYGPLPDVSPGAAPPLNLPPAASPPPAPVPAQ